MKRQFLLFAFSILSCCCTAQIITGMATKWSDDFRDWTIYTDVEDEEGNLTMRWQQRFDWTEWDYRLGEASGSIRLKWKDDPSEWEIRGGGEIITARMKWNNDIHEWRISDGSKKFTLKAPYNNGMNDWQISEEKNGIFELYMEWENDPRDWTIVDEFDEEISLHMKMAIVFVSVYHSFPKR
ncbi:MAG: hypothetical protein AAF573_12855 [Bacteroidota bacterium]